MGKQILTNEQQLLVLTSKLTFNNDDYDKIKELAMSNINWFDFFKLALYHKVENLTWVNLNTIIPNIKIPKHLNEVLQFIYLSTKQQNELYQKETTRIINLLRENHITCIPVKGANLIPNLYKDFGLRHMSDIDLIVKYENNKTIEKVMEQDGYLKGDYDRKGNIITPVSRLNDVKWKMSMSNMYPFRKLYNSEILKCIKIDFRYSLDDSLNQDAVNEMIDTYESNSNIDESFLLTHLCTHFFDEAKHTVSVVRGKDLNLIKLCDIREFVLKHKNQNLLEKAIKFSTKHNLREQIYYTMYFLDKVYCDGYEKDVLHKLQLQNISFVNSFGDSSLNSDQEFKKDFWERLFSCNNDDELSDSPKYYKI